MPSTLGGIFNPAADYAITGSWSLTAPTLTTPTITGGTSSTAVPVVTITGDGAVTIATSVVGFTKGSAAAITLAAPTAAQNGTHLWLTAGSAFAHVVTATTLIEDGVTGGAKTTLTFGAFVGASILLVAYGLKWHVVAKNVVTVS